MKMATAVVIGGGISGLSASHYLQKTAKFAKVIVIEGSNRVGGWVHSLRQEDGSVMELGPRSIRPVGNAGHNTLRLVEELGLEEEILGVGKSHAAAKNRFIYLNGQMNALPNSLQGLLKTTPPYSRPLLSYLIREPFQRQGDSEDESVYSFVKRRLGEEMAEYAFDPLCRGIFAGDCRQLSVRSCFPDIFNAERQYGSVAVGMFRMPKAKRKPCNLFERAKRERWSSYSFKKGVQQLVDVLEERANQDPGIELIRNTPVSRLEIKDNKLSVTVNGDTVTADHVISSIYARDLSKLLPEQHRQLASQLDRISAVDTVVVGLQLEGIVSLSPPGFGHLLPSRESSKILGVIYDSCTFPQHDSQIVPSTRFTVMMGGSWSDELKGLSTEDLGQLALDSLCGHLNIQPTPLHIHVHLLKNCIPQYRIGHHKVLEGIFGYIRDHNLPLSLVGSSYRGPSVNDCINNTRVEVERVTGIQL